MIGLKWKAIIGVAGAVALVAAGWQTRAWYEDSRDLSAERTMAKTLEAAMLRESSIAKLVEDKLAGLQANERIIDRGVIREVQKPIYQQVCLPDNMVDTINAEIRRGFEDEDTE